MFRFRKTKLDYLGGKMDKELITTDRETYVNTVETVPTEDSGTGWAVALIVLILAIGFGFVAFSNNQAASELRTTQALEDVRRDNLSNTFPTVVPPVTTPTQVITPVPNPAAVPQNTSTHVDVHVPEAKAPAATAPAEPVAPAPDAPAEPSPSDDTAE